MRKIIVSGLTAAGKTTHGRLIAAALKVPYFSASVVLAELIGQPGPWSPEIDARRASGELDRELDHYMVDLFDSSPTGVFDAWALPWLTSRPALRLWLDSDRPSRIRKAIVTELRRGRDPDPEAIAELVDRKDDFSRRRFLDLYGFDLFEEHACFDLVLDNSGYISSPTVAASDRGIEEFQKVVARALEPGLRSTS